jgi:predicted DNA-binding transcriptional regulator AlpA
VAEIQHDETDPYLDSFEVAKMLGVAYNTVRYYLQQARANRHAGTPKPGDLPEPDRFFGRSPVWRRSTIEAWVPLRPGKGVGGGRPKGSRTSPRD